MTLARVTIDLGSLPRRVRILADPRALQRQVLAIGEAGRMKWSRAAQQRLHTTRQAYLLGLSQAFVEGDMTVVVELSGELANALEQGHDPYSLLEGMLDSESARSGPEGRQLFVPLRMTGPGTRGAAGQPMDNVYAPPGADSRSQNAGTRSGALLIAREVHALGKKLKSGQHLGNLGLPKLQERHARDPFSGMVKAGAKGHHYYVAFRTASENRPDKWRHPGFFARNLVEEASAYVNKVGPTVLRAYAREFLGTEKVAKGLEDIFADVDGGG